MSEVGGATATFHLLACVSTSKRHGTSVSDNLQTTSKPGFLVEVLEVLEA